MTQLMEENTITSHAASSEVPAPSDAPSNEEIKKSRSFGNKVFDALVWPLVQGVGVWLVSLAIAKEATNGTNKHFEWMRTANTKMTNFFEKNLEKPVNTPIAQKIWNSDAKTWAKNLSMFVMVSFGGTIVTPITKFFESHRERISGQIDKTFKKTPKDPDLIQEEPPQTWGSIISGRAVASVVAFSTFLAIGPKNLESASNAVGKASTDVYKKIRPKGNADNFRKWADIALFDLLLTAGVVGINYISSRFVAKKHAEKQEAAAPLVAPAPMTELISESEERGDSKFTARTSQKALPSRSENHLANVTTTRGQTSPAM